MLIRVSISFLSECPKNFVEEKFHKINWLANTLNFYPNV
jgi:hypothetical protein